MEVKTKEKKFVLADVVPGRLSVGCRESEIFPIFINTKHIGFGNEERSGMIGQEANIIDLNVARDLIKVLRRAVSFA